MPAKLRAFAGACVAVLALLPAGQAGAQSLTTGSLSGKVRAEALALGGVTVTLHDPGTGLERTVETDIDGRFRFDFVPPCDCDLKVERLGYRPEWVLGVPVRPEGRLSVSVELEAAPPPVDVVDTTRFSRMAAAGVPGEVAGWVSGSLLWRLPSASRTPWEAERWGPVADPSVGADGLPATLQALSVDGSAFAAASHPSFGEPLAGAAFPLSWLEGVRLMSAEPDVEAAGGPGPLLQAYTLRGGARTEVRAFGNWSGAGLSSSRLGSPAPSHNSMQGGVIVAGPVLGDSGSFILGVEADRSELPLASWTPSDTLLARYATVAEETFGISADALRGASLLRRDVLSAFGGLGWQFSPTSRLDVRASMASLPLRGGQAGPGIDPALSGSEGAVRAQLTSQLGASVHQELVVSGDRSSRHFPGERLAGAASPVGTTVFPGGALPLWSGTSVPGDFTRTDVHAGDALFFSTGNHLLKLGAALDITSFRQAYAPGTTGSFAFGGPTQFREGVGLFQQVVGAVPTAAFSLPGFALFTQDAWEVVPGLTMQAGVRYQYTHLPRGKLTANEGWRTLTGLDNTDLASSAQSLDPRVAVSWDVQQRHEWLVLASFGRYTGAVDLSLVSEAIANDGRLSTRAGLGSLGGWPTAPDSAAAPVIGQNLTLLRRGFAPPRSTIGTLGVRKSLGGGTVLELSTTARHTSGLPRRRDLNLSATFVAHDAYGQPIYGQLVQEGGFVAAQPGSYRRFAGYDAVWALESVGTADYLGGTVSLERALNRSLRLLASFTYSKATDDWPTEGVAGAPAATAGDTVGGVAWVQGPADASAPVRAALGVDLRLPGTAGAGLFVLYGYRSGVPFTPGYGAVVDMNGDGIAGNEPAFLDNAIPGAAELFSRWGCLRSQIGHFAQRNSCRTPALQTFDARLHFPALRLGRLNASLVLDGLNLLNVDDGAVDPALFLVDPTRTLSTGADGTVAVPLLPNADFGRVGRRLGTGRTLRLGLEVKY